MADPVGTLAKRTAIYGAATLSYLYNKSLGPEFDKLDPFRKDNYINIDTGIRVDGKPYFVSLAVIPRDSAIPFIPEWSAIRRKLDIISAKSPELKKFWQKKNDEFFSVDSVAKNVKTTSMGAIPPVAKSLFEVNAGEQGWDTFRNRGIIPAKDVGRPPEYQVRDTTPNIYRGIGQMFNFSPSKVEHIVHSDLPGSTAFEVPVNALFNSLGLDKALKNPQVPGEVNIMDTVGKFLPISAGRYDPFSETAYQELADAKEKRAGDASYLISKYRMMMSDPENTDAKAEYIDALSHANKSARTALNNFDKSEKKKEKYGESAGGLMGRIPRDDKRTILPYLKLGKDYFENK
jgi:hypothetical protein